MEVFGMAESGQSSRVDESSSFDYLRDVTASNNAASRIDRNADANESISFLLDASLIAGGTSEMADTSTNNMSMSAAGAPSSPSSFLKGKDNPGPFLAKAFTNHPPTTRSKKQGFFSLNNNAPVSQFLSATSSRTSSPQKSEPNTNTKINNSNARRRSNNNSTIGTVANNSSDRNRRFQSKLPPHRKSLGETSSLSSKSFPAPTPAATKNGTPISTTTATTAANTPPRPPQIITRRKSLSTNSSSGGVVPQNATKPLFSPISVQKAPQTPGGFWTINTESKTFVNGLLSPFSPLLHSPRVGNGALPTIRSFDDGDGNGNVNHSIMNEETKQQQQQQRILDQQRKEYLQCVSLQPCRKVSVVVRVTAIDDEDNDAKRCIFPHYKNLPSAGGSGIESPARYSAFATPNRSTPREFVPNNKSPSHVRDVVVINPSAFGKHIPSHVTMETAKLVAQVANISSEDWARLYEFHHVMWPSTPSSSSFSANNSDIMRTPKSAHSSASTSSSYSTMDSLTRAVVQDLMAEHKSSLLISLGHESSCFGALNNGRNTLNHGDSIGLWTKIINQCSAMLETKGVVRLTMVEVLEPNSGGSVVNSTLNSPNRHSASGDSFRDLLAPPDQPPTPIYLRHPDMKGAVIEGLNHVEIDSIPALLEALSVSRNRKQHRRRSNGVAVTAPAATTIIGTLYYWENAVSYELKKPCNSTVTCVELASSNHNTETSESISHRKSTVSLGQALRQLLLQQVTDKHAAEHTSEVPPVISYRETTLTKVLQRSMESSKIVLIASVSPLSSDYDQTVATLNYLRRLLVKPGTTLTSPFGGGKENLSSAKGELTTPKTAKMSNRRRTPLDISILSTPEAIENEGLLQDALAKDNKMMDLLVSDPRQRLAKILHMGTPSPARGAKMPPYGSAGAGAAMSSSMIATAIDNSTVDSNHSGSQTGSYAGPSEESRQAMESPNESLSQGHRQPSWQQEDDDADNYDEKGMDRYEDFYPEESYESTNDDESHEKDGDLSKEWANEEEIKRDLLRSAKLKGQLPHNENEEIIDAQYSPEKINRNLSRDSHEDDEFLEPHDNEAYAYDARSNPSDVEYFGETQNIGGPHPDREIIDAEFEPYDIDEKDPRSNYYEPAENEGVGDDELAESSNYEEEYERAQEYLVCESPYHEEEYKQNLADNVPKIFFHRDNDLPFPNDRISETAEEEKNEEQLLGEQHIENENYYFPPQEQSNGQHMSLRESPVHGLAMVQTNAPNMTPNRLGEDFAAMGENGDCDDGAGFNAEEEDDDDVTLGLKSLVGQDDDEPRFITEEEKISGDREHVLLGENGIRGFVEGSNNYTNRITNHCFLEREASKDYDGFGFEAEEEEDEEDDDITLDLKPLAGEVDTLTEEKWRSENNGEYTIRGRNNYTGTPDSDTSERNTFDPPNVGSKVAKPTGPRFLDPSQASDEHSIDGVGNQTEYDLPDEPLATSGFVDRSYRQTKKPPSPSSHSSARSGGKKLLSQQREMPAFNSLSSPYSVTLKTSKSKECVGLTTEREQLRMEVKKLKEDLAKISVDHDRCIDQHEAQLQQLHSKLDEAYGANKELEIVANKAVTARTSTQQELENFTLEREELQRSILELRQQLKQASQNHDNYSQQYEQEIADFQARLREEKEKQRALEDIADEAVTAHQTQIEETRTLAAEREELHDVIKTLRSTIKALEEDQGDHVMKYQQEIRQLHAKLEETTEVKRSLQQAADEARFKLENQSEKMCAMNLEREELRSTLNSVKCSAKKASGDHNEVMKRFREEIQQLRDKLDEAVRDKLEAKKSADEIQFAKDDMEREVEHFEEELSACRANNLRLEESRREDQKMIQRLNSEIRRRDSEKIDWEHFRSESQRLKLHSDHLESLVAHNKLEYSVGIKQLEERLDEERRKNLKLDEEISRKGIDLTSCQKQNEELKESLRAEREVNLKLTRELNETNVFLESLQSRYDELESLRATDQGIISKLNDQLRTRESESAKTTNQLNQKLLRIQQDRDRLHSLMGMRRVEYEKYMEERADEVSTLASKLDSMAKEIENAKTTEKRYRSDAKTQLRLLRESESNVRQRDIQIHRLLDEVETLKKEVLSLRGREISESHSEQEVEDLKGKIYALEVDLEKTKNEKEEALASLGNESRSRKSLFDELEKATTETDRYKRALESVKGELNQRNLDDERFKDILPNIEWTIQDLKTSRKGGGSFTTRSNEPDSVFEERTLQENNRSLTSDLHNLNDMVEKFRRERDTCLQNLQDGQKKLSELSSKNSVNGMDNTFTTPANQYGKRQREHRSASRLFSTPISVTIPEIYVSGVPPTVHAEDKAEEFAAFLALSTRKAMKENFEEVSQLRSQIHRLEDERSEQVSALKTRVRDLQQELSYEKVYNQTPVMGKRSVNRPQGKSHHFMDADEEKYGY